MVVAAGGAAVVVGAGGAAVVVGAAVVGAVELLGGVEVGPASVSFWAGAKPSRAATIEGSLPSMPSAQMPRPPRWKLSASWASM